MKQRKGRYSGQRNIDRYYRWLLRMSIHKFSHILYQYVALLNFTGISALQLFKQS